MNYVKIVEKKNIFSMINEAIILSKKGRYGFISKQKTRRFERTYTKIRNFWLF